MEVAVKQDNGAPGGRLPARPEGLVDLLPGQARRRRELEDAMLRPFHAWGYEPVQTPALELMSTVALGVRGEQLQRLFKFADSGGDLVALVGERTVPAARVAAGQLRGAPRPLRLCYIGPTFAAYPPGGGRRESSQAGAELIGSASAAADAEVVALAIEALAGSGLEAFQVEIGHVGFFGGLMEGLGDAERRLVGDALAGRDLVELEQALAGTPLAERERRLLLRFPALRGGPELLDAARGMVDNPVSGAALDRLEAVYALLQAHGVERWVNIDLGAVRDFDYYTGLIFEAFATDAGAPVAAGGRYDALLRRFGRDEPATGFVVLLDRVQQLLEGARNGVGQRPDGVLVGHQGDVAAAVRACAELRSRGQRAVLEPEAVDPAAIAGLAAARGLARGLMADGG